MLLNSRSLITGIPRTLELFGYNVAGADTVNLPAGLQDGDIGVFSHRVEGAAGFSAPAGWTAWMSGQVATWRMSVLWKRLTAAESGAAVTGASGNFGLCYAAVWRTFPRCNTVTPGAVNQQYTTGDPTLQTVSVADLRQVVLVIGQALNTDAAFSTSGTLQTAMTARGGYFQNSAYERYYWVPNQRVADYADFTWDMTDGGAVNMLCSSHLILT